MAKMAVVTSEKQLNVLQMWPIVILLEKEDVSVPGYFKDLL